MHIEAFDKHVDGKNGKHLLGKKYLLGKKLQLLTMSIWSCGEGTNSSNRRCKAFAFQTADAVTNVPTHPGCRRNSHTQPTINVNYRSTAGCLLGVCRCMYSWYDFSLFQTHSLTFCFSLQTSVNHDNWRAPCLVCWQVPHEDAQKPSGGLKKTRFPVGNGFVATVNLLSVGDLWIHFIDLYIQDMDTDIYWANSRLAIASARSKMVSTLGGFPGNRWIKVNRKRTKSGSSPVFFSGQIVR